VSKDRVASVIFLVFGIYGFIFSIHIPMGEWQSPGPGIFPLCISIVLCLSGASWFIGNKKSKSIEKVSRFTVGKESVDPLKVVGITLIFILLMDRIGYLLGSSLYLFILLLFVSRYRFSVSLVFAIVLGGGSWLFFGKLLGVELPIGPEFLPF
jgi:putative tricarboxylic transport membrane protein